MDYPPSPPTVGSARSEFDFETAYISNVDVDHSLEAPASPMLLEAGESPATPSKKSKTSSKKTSSSSKGKDKNKSSAFGKSWTESSKLYMLFLGTSLPRRDKRELVMVRKKGGPVEVMVAERESGEKGEKEKSDKKYKKRKAQDGK